MVLEELRDVAYAAKPEKRKIKQSVARNVSDIKIETENSFEDNGNASFDEKRGENDKEVDEFISQTSVRVGYSQI